MSTSFDLATAQALLSKVSYYIDSIDIGENVENPFEGLPTEEFSNETEFSA